ncbi:MAG: hypothetical protein QOE35_649 [Actinomycetota bacterium]|jgi:DivIVA domain-containing protein
MALRIPPVTLSPDEIERRVFLVSLRGYDKDEVHAFLNQVATDYRHALASADGDGDPFERLGDEVASVVRTAVEQARQLRERAAAEVEELLASAEADASALRAHAQADADRIRAEAQYIADQAKEQAVAEAIAQVDSIVSAALARYADADQAERELMEHLEHVSASVAETRRRLGDRPLLSLLEEATRPAEAHEQGG